MQPNDSAAGAAPPVHRLWLTMIAFNGALGAAAVYLPGTAVSQIGLLTWSLLHLGIQVAWTVTLVGDAQIAGASGALTRTGTGFFMVLTCFLAQVWNGFVLAQLMRVAAVRLRESNAAAAERLDRCVGEAAKLLLVGFVAVVVDIVLVSRAAPVDENSSYLQQLLTERPSMADDFGMVNAALLAAFHLVYAWFTLRTIQRLVPELAKARVLLCATPKTHA